MEVDIDRNRLIQTDLDGYKQIWGIQKDIDRYVQIWIDLDRFRKKQTAIDRCTQVQVENIKHIDFNRYRQIKKTDKIDRNINRQIDRKIDRQIDGQIDIDRYG